MIYLDIGIKLYKYLHKTNGFKAPNIIICTYMGHTFLSTREANLGATHHANRYAKELFLGYHIFQNNIFNIHTYVCVCSQSSSSTVDLSSANQIMQISVKGPMDQRKPSNIMCSCMSFSLATLQPAIVAKRKTAAGQFFFR